MSTSTSIYRSITIRAGAAPSAGGASDPTPIPTLVHVLWLSEPALIDSARLGSELDAAAHPPTGRGFSAGAAALAGAPSAVIQLFDATASELHAASERAKQLHPGCLSMAFDAHPGFDIAAAVSANLQAMGLAASLPDSGSSNPAKRI